jgi:hypothetical protein
LPGVQDTAAVASIVRAANADEDDLPCLFATPAEEVEYWRTRTLGGRRCKPLPDLSRCPTCSTT